MMPLDQPIAMTVGDAAGIGPEIIVKAAEMLRERIEAGRLVLQVVGRAASLDEARVQLGLPADNAALVEAVDVGPVDLPLRTGEVGATTST